MKHFVKYWDAINCIKEFHGDGTYPDKKAVDGLFGMVFLVSGLFEVDTGKIFKDSDIDPQKLPRSKNDPITNMMQ